MRQCAHQDQRLKFAHARESHHIRAALACTAARGPLQRTLVISTGMSILIFEVLVVFFVAW